MYDNKNILKELLIVNISDKCNFGSIHYVGFLVQHVFHIQFSYSILRLSFKVASEFSSPNPVVLYYLVFQSNNLSLS